MGGTIDQNYGCPFGMTREQMEISKLRAENERLTREREEEVLIMDRTCKYIADKMPLRGAHSVFENIDAAVAERDQLREQLAEARKDGERLNWLESDMPTSLIAWTDAASGCRLVQVGDLRGVGQDVRSAIDAAMKGDSRG